MNERPPPEPVLRRMPLWLALGALAVLGAIAVWRTGGVLGFDAPGWRIGASAPAAVPEAPQWPAAASSDPGPTTGDRFFFDVSGHPPQEIIALLERAEALHATAGDNDPVSIVVVLHGPDLALFTRRRYAEFPRLNDLAARLDAFGVIDFKVCERSVADQGLDAKAFPPFIELVPYAPDEIARLKAEGYVQL